MTDIYDAMIIGAGPAGLSTALELLQNGWRVLIAEKQALPRVKVCGGFIGPENISLLESYGVMESLFQSGAHKVSNACLTASNNASVKIPVASKKSAYSENPYPFPHRNIKFRIMINFWATSKKPKRINRDCFYCLPTQYMLLNSVLA